MKKLLIVVDMQNDFIDGSLGTDEAVSIVQKVSGKIKTWCDSIIFTKDTHGENYLSTQEGKMLPIKHCIAGTHGWELADKIQEAFRERETAPDTGSSIELVLNKYTFGSSAISELIRGYGFDYIELVGLCTDICVVSNALLLKVAYPETEIAVDASCCAGVTPETHKAAIDTMRCCQVKIIGE